MSNFITPADYSASIHQEILQAITRNDSAMVEIAEDRAIEEMRAYLRVRYDCDAIFNASGSSRHQLILMFAIDITIFHLFSAGNPIKMTQIRQDRYDRAVEWLKAVNKGSVNPTGLPLLTPVETHSFMQYGSNPKRQNHY